MKNHSIMGKFFYQNVDGREKLRLGRILFLAILCVLLFWSVTFIVILKAKDPGIIGDSFGMMNALFSALAFALLIYTSLLQTQELELQRREIEENRKQLEASAKAHKELVDLTRLINQDKLNPYLEIASQSLIGKSYFIRFKILGSTAKIDGLASNESSTPQYTYLPNDDRREYFKEGDITGLYEINSELSSKTEHLIVRFKTLDGRSFKQDLYLKNDNLYLGNAEEEGQSGLFFVD